MKIGDLPAFLLCVIRVVSYFTYCLDTRIDSEYTRDNAFSESNRKRDCVNCEAGILGWEQNYVYNKRITG